MIHANPWIPHRLTRGTFFKRGSSLDPINSRVPVRQDQELHSIQTRRDCYIDNRIFCFYFSPCNGLCIKGCILYWTVVSESTLCLFCRKRSQSERSAWPKFFWMLGCSSRTTNQSESDTRGWNRYADMEQTCQQRLCHVLCHQPGHHKQLDHAI